MLRHNWMWIVVLIGTLTMNLGCGKNPPNGYGDYGESSVEFKNNPKTNVTVTSDQLDLSFLDAEGNSVRLADYRGKNNIVLVFMRGNPGGA